MSREFDEQLLLAPHRFQVHYQQRAWCDNSSTPHYESAYEEFGSMAEIKLWINQLEVDNRIEMEDEYFDKLGAKYGFERKLIEVSILTPVNPELLTPDYAAVESELNKIKQEKQAEQERRLEAQKTSDIAHVKAVMAKYPRLEWGK